MVIASKLHFGGAIIAADCRRRFTRPMPMRQLQPVGVRLPRFHAHRLRYGFTRLLKLAALLIAGQRTAAINRRADGRPPFLRRRSSATADDGHTILGLPAVHFKHAAVRRRRSVQQRRHARRRICRRVEIVAGECFYVFAA